MCLRLHSLRLTTPLFYTSWNTDKPSSAPRALAPCPSRPSRRLETPPITRSACPCSCRSSPRVLNRPMTLEQPSTACNGRHGACGSRSLWPSTRRACAPHLRRSSPGQPSQPSGLISSNRHWHHLRVSSYERQAAVATGARFASDLVHLYPGTRLFPPLLPSRRGIGRFLHPDPSERLRGVRSLALRGAARLAR